MASWASQTVPVTMGLFLVNSNSKKKQVLYENSDDWAQADTLS